MKRREFLRLAATTTLFAAAPRVLAEAGGKPSDWRTYELTYEVDLSSLKALAISGYRCLSMVAITSGYYLSIGRARPTPCCIGMKPTRHPYSAPLGGSTTNRQVTAKPTGLQNTCRGSTKHAIY